jgi:hypothetical protein
VLPSYSKDVAKALTAALFLVLCRRSLNYDSHIHDFLDLEAVEDSENIIFNEESSSMGLTN